MKSWLFVALSSLTLALAASCLTADEPEGAAAEEELAPGPDEESAQDVIGQQCGPVVCTGKTHCCNASCGRCVPFGVECPQEACAADEPEVDPGGAGEESVVEDQADFVVGEQCGPTFCTGAKPRCCNASCGICVPFGAECTQEHTC